MTRTARQKLLKANALFLLTAGGLGFITDIVGIVTGAGPQARILAAAPHAGIGFVEAHGLAFIFGVLLWGAAATRQWHVTAAAIHALLGISNVCLWGIFTATDMVGMGIVVTALHGLFVLMQVTAAAEAPTSAASRSSGASPESA